MKILLDRKNSTAVRLAQKVLNLVNLNNAPSIRDILVESQRMMEDLKGFWLALASSEYACGRVWMEYINLLRNWTLDSFTEAVLNEKITLPDNMRTKFDEYKREFASNCDLNVTFSP